MTLVWDNPMLNLRELADKAKVKYDWILAVMDSSDPVPSIQRGKRKLVLWSDYIEWAKERYGDGAPYRGGENLDVSGF
jgi:hypothetical protein